MATSSITKNFVISGERAVEAFLDAYEEAERDREARGSDVSPNNIKEITDQEELRNLVRGWERKHGRNS